MELCRWYWVQKRRWFETLFFQRRGYLFKQRCVYPAQSEETRVSMKVNIMYEFDYEDIVEE